MKSIGKCSNTEFRHDTLTLFFGAGVQSFWRDAPTKFILPMALARIDLNQKTVLFAAPNGGAAVIPCCMPHSWPSQMTVPGQSRQFCDVCAESAFLSVPKTPSI